MVRDLFSKLTRFRTEVLTDVGLREHNEDDYLILKIAPATYFLAVADGMGGKAGGKIASRLVISSVEDYLKTEFKKQKSTNNLKEILSKTFLVAQTAVSDKTASNPELKGMGTTLVAVLIHDGKYVWGNIGDSRFYLMSGGELTLMTEDHSYIREFIRNHNQELPPNILRQYTNIVTKIIDGGTDKPDVFPTKEDSAVLKPGDLFLLCSDGMIPDKIQDQCKSLESIIIHNQDIRKMSRKLLDHALKKGSDDNITVVLGLFGTLLIKPPQDEFKTIRIIKNQQ